MRQVQFQAYWAKHMAWKEVGLLKRVQQWNVWAVAKHYRVTHSMPSA